MAATELLVRDYLQKQGLSSTLRALNNECIEQNRPKPTVEEWVDFAQAFDLPNLILHYNRAVRRGGADQAILDIILRHYSASFLAADNETIASAEVGLGNEASDDEQGQPTIRIHEISATTGEATELDQQQLSVRPAHERRDRKVQVTVHEAPSFSIRPKPSYHNSTAAAGESLASSHHQHQETALGGTAFSATAESSMPPSEKLGGADSLLETRTAPGEETKRHHHHHQTTNGMTPAEAEAAAKRAAAVAAAAERGHHSEYWISQDFRQRSLRRDLQVLRRNDEEQQRLRSVMGAQTKHQAQGALQKNHVLEDYGRSKKRPCGVCDVLFSVENLPVAVTLKAIYDLRHSWLLRDAARQSALRQKEVELALKAPRKEHEKGSGFASLVTTQSTAGSFGKKLAALAGKTKLKGGAGESSPSKLKQMLGGSSGVAAAAANSPSSSSSSSSSSAAAGGGGGGSGGGSSSNKGKMWERESAKRISTLTQNSAKISVMRSYDTCRVCCFCAQFFDQDEVYRPSYGAKLARLMLDKEEKELQEDDLYWDPLANRDHAAEIDTGSKRYKKRMMRRARAAAEEAVARGETPISPEAFMMQHMHQQKSSTFFLAAGGHSHKHGDDPTAEQKKKGGRRDENDSSSTDSSLVKPYKPRVKVRGHARKHTKVVNLADEKDEKELEQFKEQARGTAFWHAGATDTLMTKGRDSFRRKPADRNRAPRVEIPTFKEKKSDD